MRARRVFITRLALIAAVGLAVRVTFVLVARRTTKPGGDDFYYHWLGILLARGKGFVDPTTWKLLHISRPTAAHPPLYPVYLGIVSRAGVQSVLGHRLASCLLGAGTVFVIGLVAGRLGGERAGYAAALIAAVYPNLWINDANLMSESLDALAIALVLLAAYVFFDAPTLRRAVWLGLACSMAALTRAEGVLLFPLLVIPLTIVVRGFARHDRVKWAGAACVVGLLCIMPWVGANLVRFQRPETMTSGFGTVLTLGNCDSTYRGTYLGYWNWDCSMPVWPAGCSADEERRYAAGDRSIPYCDESIVDAAARKKATTYMSDHLGRMPLVMLARVGRAFDVYAPFQGVRFNEFFESRGRLPSLWGLWAYWATAALGIGGAIVVGRRSLARLLPPAAIIVIIAATSAISFGITRYRVPVDVVAIVFAGVGIDALLRLVVRAPAHEEPAAVETATMVDTSAS
ncbi:MAG TPA: glycosyltransferase family 39 protein [Acidimicrobiia bacterium]|nr:glycosyltransferase family 39 protein [Acidimicrobiia bacterium]